MTTEEKMETPSLSSKIKRQIKDNRLDGDKGRFGAYGKPISSYEESFDLILDGSISDLLKNKPFPVVVDLMGPSDTIVSLFEAFPSKSKFGLAVSLEDLRSDFKKERDANLNVIQIAGDILETSTWNEIKKKLPDGRGADLIMERALMGFESLPRDVKVYSMLLNRAWRLLSKNNGVLLAEVELGYEAEAARMIEYFKEHKINASIGASEDKAAAIKVVKTQNSPEKLPFPPEI